MDRKAAMKYVALESLYGCTNCGMAPMARNVAEAKLKALAAGASLLNKDLAGA
jgi:5-methyltetrahydropteroyltriglutamate--homocysteine methyltransferase